MTASSEKRHPALSAEIVSSVKERLWEETALGVANTVGKLREAWYTGSSAVFYTREREQFEKYIPPFQYGLAATVFLFLNFRVTGSTRFQQWRKGVWSRFRPKDLHKQEPSISTQQTPTVGYLETERRKKAMRSMRLLTDTLISLAFGTTGHSSCYKHRSIITSATTLKRLLYWLVIVSWLMRCVQACSSFTKRMPRFVWFWMTTLNRKRRSRYLRPFLPLCRTAKSVQITKQD